MNEEKRVGENVDTTTTTGENNQSSVQNTIPDTKQVNNEEQKGLNFTQEQVNNIVRERLEKIYKSYGVSKKEDLDALFEKTKDYDQISEKNKSLEKQILFSKNSIDDDRIDDVETYFKGKNLEFNQENLSKAIETHKEWVKKIVVPDVGGERQGSGKAEVDVDKMFGIKKYVSR